MCSLRALRPGARYQSRNGLNAVKARDCLFRLRNRCPSWHTAPMTGPLPPPLDAHYSTAAAVSVEEFVAETWPLPEPIEAALLNRGFNDIFDV